MLNIEDDLVGIEHPEAKFHELAQPVIKLLKEHGFDMFEDTNVYGRLISYKVGHARKNHDRRVLVTYRLQDDGGEPYMVYDVERIEKLMSADAVKRVGYGAIILGAVHLYPHQMELIPEIVKRLEALDVSNLQFP